MRKRFFYAVIAVVVLILAGAIWWWQRPANVALAAIAKLGAAQTQRFDANLTIDNTETSQALLGEQAQVQLLLKGGFARKENERDSLAAEVKLITETEGITLRVDADTRFIDDKAYLRITQSPQAFPSLVQLKDQWLELPRGGTSEEGEVDDSEDLFAEVERTGTDRVGDRSAVTYTVQATSGAVVQMLDGVADILGTRLTSEQINSVRSSITDVQTVPVELWVTPISHELVKLSATLTIPGGNTIAFTLIPTERNKPVEIARPDDAITLEGAVAGLQADNNQE